MTDDTSLPPSPPQKPRKAWKWLLAAGLGVVVAGGLVYAGVAVWDGLRPMIAGLNGGSAAGQRAPTDIDRLRHDLAQAVQELDETRTRLAQVEARPMTAPSAEDKALEGRVAALEKNAADASTVLRMADRLERIDAQLRDMETRRKGDVAQILAIALLRDALGAGRPFDAELRTVKALSGDNPDYADGLARLKPFAAAGIPVAPVLVERFFTREAAILRADSLPGGDVNSWWSKALDRLLTVVSVHREDGETGGVSAAAIVARAHAALGRADLAGAVREADQLTGPAAQAAQPWLVDAKARLEADRVVGDWAAQAVASVGAKL